MSPSDISNIRCVNRYRNWPGDATFAKDNPAVQVLHGSGVETMGESFFEGAWDGDFGAGEFLGSLTCAGSGGRASPGSVNFCSPTHTLEPLFALRAEDNLHVSNSLVFVLATAEDDVDVNYPFYHHDFASVIDGIDKYVRAVPTRRGKKLEQYYHCNFAVLSDLSVKVQRKNNRAAFSNYSEYETFLRSSVLSLCANAVDPRRRRTYKPLATVSSGYDSPAAAALAASAGCKKALTFAIAREDFEDSDDSGEAIGKKLGMSVGIYDRTEYRNAVDLPEAEFLATGMGGEDVVMSAFEEVLDGKVLFTGFHGDKVWHYGTGKGSKTIVRGDASGGSLGEFRLRVGFIHLPIPFIGCLQQPSINEITMSSEMREWYLHRDTETGQIYNRPIPRRIVEEAGVPRDWFGSAKAGGNTTACICAT